VLVGGNLDPAKNNGNVRSQTITVPTISAIAQAYTYDELNRLKVAQEAGASGWTENFGYDRFGNRTSLSVTQNASYPLSTIAPEVDAATNRFKKFNAQSQPRGYDYDAAGNLTQEPGPSSTFTLYVYDAENRLIQAKSLSGQTETLISSYAYDGGGRRVKRIVADTASIYAYNAGGQMLAEYTSGPVNPSATTSYLTEDHLGTPRAISDSTGQVIERHDYLPFGEEIPIAYNNRTNLTEYGADAVRQKFTSHERDDETGLDFAKARYYSSYQGRFAAVDPYNPIVDSVDDAAFKGYLAETQKWNRYTYALNSPFRYIDPLGEDILLTGSEAVQKMGLNRLRRQLGEERFNLLDYVQEYVEGVGNVTVVKFGSAENKAKFEAIGGDNQIERLYSTTMSDIIGSSLHVEYRLATRFQYKGIGFGNTREIVTTSLDQFGGAATVNANESLTGNVQIFVAPDAKETAFRQVQIDHQLGIFKSNDKKLLSFTDEQIDAHEFGHAWTYVKLGLRVEGSGRAITMENIVRIRQNSSIYG
jgi:RHS repeat-associated protein